MFFLFVLLKAIRSIVSINSNKVNHSLRPWFQFWFTVTWHFHLIIYYVRLLLYYIMYFVPSSSCSYRSVIINVFLAKLTSIFVFNICLNSPVSMFGNLCFDLVSKFEMVIEQNYGTDVEQFRGHDKRFILHCVRFRSG